VRTGPFAHRISVVHRLRDQGLSLKAAHTAITELAEFDHTICLLPEDANLDTLVTDLAKLDVGLRRNAVMLAPCDYLRDVRMRHSLSQSQFAVRIGVQLGTLQNWEQGRNRPDPAILTLVRIFDRNPSLVADALFEPL
jgi:DNA-binding transcriptional regulator YiaG